ncbi:hypothetical protein CC80DRAFT_493248 [Byssothecium circinans]|uniref:Uncharacterized protein n=1 Tax=Byssothecium circinans TaxID=147558 RepID=A0A6A5TR01_9PLEO|nr:hypothetical protein CC80DRAFT_493248 [Byssothecium circinans]
MVRGGPGSVRSIRTGSSSSPLNTNNAPPSTATMPNSIPSTTPPSLPKPAAFPMLAPPVPRKAVETTGSEVLRVGMKVPDRKHWPNLALTSNPISPSVFPNPPMAKPSSGARVKDKGKTGSWPLPEG